MEPPFPRLTPDNHEMKSPADGRYNCVAWAVAPGDMRCWWPTTYGGYYWPPGFSRVLSVDNFRQVFEALGYQAVDGGALEAGFERIAIYGHAAGEPSHVARQLPNGNWTSKLGRREDIIHQGVGDLEGEHYGSVVLFLRRARPARSLPAPETG